MIEHTQLAGLEDGERERWEYAVDYYRERVIARDLLFNRGLVAVRDELAAFPRRTD